MSIRYGVQLCVPFTEKKLNSWFKECGWVLVQPKLNGHHFKWSNGKLLSSQGNEITSLPEHVKILERNFLNFNFEGELYNHELCFQDITSIVKRKTAHVNRDKITLYAFDLADLSTISNLSGKFIKAKDRKLILEEKLKKLTELEKFVKVIQTKIAKTYDDVYGHLINSLDQGYEGIVVRHPNGEWVPRRSTMVMKWKPWKEDEYIIVDTVEGMGKYSGTLGALIVSKDNTKFHVGSFKITDQERDKLWQQRDSIIGMKARIRYCAVSKDTKPPSSVFTLLVK